MLRVYLVDGTAEADGGEHAEGMYNVLTAFSGEEVERVALGPGESYTPEDVAIAINQLDVSGRTVVLLPVASTPGTLDSEWVNEVFESVLDSTSIVVVPAGNVGVDVDAASVMPCAAPAEMIVCVGVTEVDPDGVVVPAAFGSGYRSSYGASVDLYVDLDRMSLAPPRRDLAEDGTSTAAAIVVALLRVAWESDPTLTGLEALEVVRECLTDAETLLTPRGGVEVDVVVELSDRAIGACTWNR